MLITIAAWGRKMLIILSKHIRAFFCVFQIFLVKIFLGMNKLQLLRTFLNL